MRIPCPREDQRQDLPCGTSAQWSALSITIPDGCTVNCLGDQNNFTGLQGLIDETKDGGTLELTKDYVATPGESGIKILKDQTITIDLKGHTINRNLTAEVSDGYVIYNNEGTLTIKDSVGGGKITGGWTSTHGGGIYNNGTLTLESGTISGNKAHTYGGGVYNYEHRLFTMNGGSILGNTAQFGGGVYNYDYMTMCGGTITGNTATERGGGIFSSNASFSIGNGSVINVTGNKAAGTENNVYLSPSAPMTVNSVPAAGSKLGVYYRNLPKLS